MYAAKSCLMETACKTYINASSSICYRGEILLKTNAIKPVLSETTFSVVMLLLVCKIRNKINTLLWYTTNTVCSVANFQFVMFNFIR